MIRLLQRTETEKKQVRYLWQQAQIDKNAVVRGPFPWTPTVNDTCYFCRYCQTFRSESEYEDCTKKHACSFSKFPFISINKAINAEFNGTYENPDGSEIIYERTGIFKQVTFEAQPHHIELYLCVNGQCQCNASCWYHAWRLANKKTWRQCGKTHLCQNDGSAWVQLAPSNPILYNEYLEQL